MIFLISGQSDLCPSLGKIRRKLETESEDGKMLSQEARRCHWAAGGVIQRNGRSGWNISASKKQTQHSHQLGAQKHVSNGASVCTKKGCLQNLSRERENHRERGT